MWLLFWMRINYQKKVIKKASDGACYSIHPYNHKTMINGYSIVYSESMQGEDFHNRLLIPGSKESI